MRLRRFEIHNFKGVANSSLDWDDIVVLIGENNVGKSTVLQALECFLAGSQLRDHTSFTNYDCDLEHAVELIGYFDQLTDAEKAFPAVRGRMNGDDWIIKKKFWAEGGDDGAKTWKEMYYSFSTEENFADWPTPDAAWAAFPEAYESLIEQISDHGTRTNIQTRERLKTLVREQKPELIAAGESKWIESPGGGGNWKSNANSIIPRLIRVKAVHDAAEESLSKDASTYGKIVGLLVEKKLMARPELAELKAQIDKVLKLFAPDPDHPENQAEEIRDIQKRINDKLNEVIGGIVSIKTSEPDIRPVLLPSTTLVIRDKPESIETDIADQGHGLQRTLIVTLLQILGEIQSEAPVGAVVPTRPTILAVEEPELYMHPQMERKMRDALLRVAGQPGIQVVCTTHSSVFFDMAQRHRSIVRVVKDGHVTKFVQVMNDIFDGANAKDERDRLRFLSTFNPAVNELFFARRVVLCEERSAIAAFERAGELTGLFDRHPGIRHDVTLLDADGKDGIPLFQKVLNHFSIPYLVVHDEDQGNAPAQAANVIINDLVVASAGRATRLMISPTDIEGLLGYPTPGKQKVYQAVKKVEELCAAGGLPAAFIAALNTVYFGVPVEPAAAA